MPASLARGVHAHPAPARAELAPLMLAGIVALGAVLILLPLALVLGMGFVEGNPLTARWGFGLGNYAAAFADPFTWRVLANTLVFAAVMLGVALLFGVPIAWLVERTDFPGQTVLFTAMTAGLLIPGLATAMGWLMLLHPRIGIVNRWVAEAFGLAHPPFSILSLEGMGFVQGLSLAPLVFIMTAASFRAIDPALEEAGLVAGAAPRAAWRRITLRLAWPSILAAAIFTFTIGFAAFDVPAVIGWPARIFTFSTYLYSLYDAGLGEAPHYGLIAALSTAVILCALALSWWYARVQAAARRYEVVTGKGYRPRILRLGAWAWPAWGFVGLFLVLSELLPLLALLWMALIPYLLVPSAAAMKLVSLHNFGLIGWSQAAGAIGNTVILMLLTPLLTLAAAVSFSWVVLRSRLPGRWALDLVAFLPHAVPSVIFGIAILLVGLYLLAPIYGTVWLLLLSFVVGRLSYATRMTNGALGQINRELDECARISGASGWGAIKGVLVPLMRPALLYAGLWIALLCFRELTLAVFLTMPGNMTLSVYIWDLWTGGNQGPAAAMTLIMLALMAPLIALYWSLARRRDSSVAQP